MLWKKRALGNRADLFKIERKDISAKKEQREIGELKSQIAHKDSVIAWKKQESFSVQPESAEFRYKIASKVLENGVRVVANA